MELDVVAESMEVSVVENVVVSVPLNRVDDSSLRSPVVVLVVVEACEFRDRSDLVVSNRELIINNMGSGSFQ